MGDMVAMPVEGVAFYFFTVAHDINDVSKT